MNIIEARNITRMFPVGDGEFYALKHVDIDIPAGKLTILKGRSGSGKTTLMNILSALDAPTEGDVSFDGQVYSEMEDAQKEQLRRKEIGFVFQAVALIPIMNAYENVDFAMRVMQLFRNLIEKEGVTIVMTTHDPNLMELGDVVYELEDGEIIDRQIRE